MSKGRTSFVEPKADSAHRQNNMAMYSDLMRRDMDHKSYSSAMDNAYQICEQMNTTTLVPALYYDLYLALQQHLSILDMYLRTDYISSGNDILDLYEDIQTFPSVLSRLYLMCVIGASAVKTKKVQIITFLKDIVEMSRAVQHPTKGIFLRNYILDSIKTVLPDNTTENEEEGKLVNSVEFLLNNFSEMCRLLVRLTQGPHVTEQRVEEQQQLCQVVGKNLMILSNLEGVTLELYSTNILPRFLEYVILSRDKVAQDYLYDAIIQAFPAEYQLETLHLILHSLGGVVHDVGIKRIMCSLMLRISSYVKSTPTLEKEMNVFQIFATHITQIIKTQTLSSFDFVSIYSALADLSIVWHTEDDAYTYINTIFNTLYSYLDQKELNSDTSSKLAELLEFPFTRYDICKVLSINKYSELQTLLPYPLRHSNQRKIVEKLSETQFILSNKTELLLCSQCVETLYKDSKDMTPLNDDELLLDCTLYRTVFLATEITSEFFDMASIVLEAISVAGNRRTLMLLPTVISFYLRAVNVVEHEQLFHQIFKLLKQLRGLSASVALTSSIEIATIASQVSYHQTSYFFEYALSIFEDHKLLDSSLLKSLLSSLASTKLEDYDNEMFINAAVKFIATLPNANERSKLYCDASLALYNEQCKNSKLSYTCIQKAVKEASSCQEVEQNLYLFVSILNVAIVQYIKGNPDVTSSYVNELAKFVRQGMEQQEFPTIQKFFDETILNVTTRNEPALKELQL